MNSSTVLANLRRLRSQMAAHLGQEQSDEQLLSAYSERRDEAAFAALVHRYGPMVLGVCRRLLGHEQDAEDVFQATFLVLARRAAALRNQTALSGFLHGTACHLASKAKRAAGRRRKYERSLEALAQSRAPANPADQLSWREVRTLLDEGIARLPEKYRSVFVLCILEGVSREEAARRLDLKEGTLSSRLGEARKRLGQRLARRGVELTAVLAAAAAMTPPASALPVGLLTGTIEAAMGDGLAGVVSASVAELVRSATTAMILSKAKMAAALLLTATLLAGAGAWTCRILATPQLAAPQKEAPTVPSRPSQGNNAEATRTEKPSTIVSGRVLAPDGKPVKGARLYWPHLRKEQPISDRDIAMIPRGTSDADGRFRLELPGQDFRPLMVWQPSLVAVAEGYGLAWTELPKKDRLSEVTLRLVKDQAIQGSIVNTEGKPLAGLRVTVVSLAEKPQGQLDEFLAAWKRNRRGALEHLPRRLEAPLDPLALSAVTDKDGKFRIAGIGAERLAVLRVQGRGLAQASLEIIARAGFDPASLNRATRERIPSERRNLVQPSVLYGPEFKYVAVPERIIEGIVREAGSGKPVAGMIIEARGFSREGWAGYDGFLTTVSDKEGHYRLHGLPRIEEYDLWTRSPEDGAWLTARAHVEGDNALQPLKADFTVARGVIVAGRLIDKTTGKSVKGEVNFVPLPGNKFFGKPGYTYSSTLLHAAEGRFRLVVVPGPGVLTARSWVWEKIKGGREIDPYKRAEFDAKDLQHVKVLKDLGGDQECFVGGDGALEFLSIRHAVKYFDLASDAAPTTCDLFVDRGRSLSVKIADAEGKPLTGATVAGVSATSPTSLTNAEATCTIFALDPKRPRQIVVYHPQRKLAGTLALRGDEKSPSELRLHGIGAVMGRVLDPDDRPIDGADIAPLYPHWTASELYSELRKDQPPIRTDKDGRFRLESIIPQLKFRLSIHREGTFFVGEPRIGSRQIKPGESLNLGDLRVKPAR